MTADQAWAFAFLVVPVPLAAVLISAWAPAADWLLARLPGALNPVPVATSTPASGTAPHHSPGHAPAAEGRAGA